MPDLEIVGPHFIVCPHCGYRFDLSKHKVNKNTHGEKFISCPRPGQSLFDSDRKKPACGQYIALTDDLEVVPEKAPIQMTG
ncbi:MAG: hypothetical protein IKE91_02525 [Clostridia bacterium]|nr:hypothetical protein [Clostridia bacterium]